VKIIGDYATSAPRFCGYPTDENTRKCMEELFDQIDFQNSVVIFMFKDDEDNVSDSEKR